MDHKIIKGLSLVFILFFSSCNSKIYSPEILNLSNYVVYVETKIKNTGSTDTNGDIILLDISNKKKYKITNDDFYDYLPVIQNSEKKIYFLSNRNSSDYKRKLFQDSSPKGLFCYSIGEGKTEYVTIKDVNGKSIDDLPRITNLIYSSKTDCLYFTQADHLLFLNLKTKILAELSIKIENVKIILSAFISEDGDKIILNCMMNDLLETGLFIYTISHNKLERIKDDIFLPLEDVEIRGYSSELNKYYIFRKTINSNSYERDDIEIYEFFPNSSIVDFKTKISKSSQISLSGIFMNSDLGFYFVDTDGGHWGNLAFYNLQSGSKHLLTFDDSPKSSFNYFLN
jgi:hypothetical protein